MSGTTFNIEKLDDQNYNTWKLNAKSVLIYNDLWGYVDGTIREPVDASQKANWEIKDSKALAIITLSVKEGQLSYIGKVKSSREAWTSLEKIHASGEPSRKVMLYKHLFNMQKGKDETMAKHLRNFQQNLDNLAEIGVVIPKELSVIMLLNTLPSDYENFVVAMEARDDLPEMMSLKSKLLEEEMRKVRGETNEQTVNNSAFVVTNFKKKNNRTIKTRPNTLTANKGSNTFTGKCFVCDNKGHRASECKFRRRMAEKSTTGQKCKEIAMMTDVHSVVSDEGVWCLDSGASAHMCNDRNKFNDLNKNHRILIQTAGHEMIETHGIGTVKIKTVDVDGSVLTITLREVYFVPKLKHNLISVSKVTRNGFQVSFSNKCGTVKAIDDTVTFKAYKKDRIYIIQTETDTAMLTSERNINKGENYWLKWHQRLGHLNFQDLKKLVKTDLVDGINLSSDIVNKLEIKCVVCSKGKIAQIPYTPATTRDNETIGTIHSDICGPFSVASLGGAKYFATFICDKSRFMEVVFLKKRSDIFDEFKKFKARVERDTGLRIKRLRTDNAKEYVSSEFTKYLETHGIRHQLSVEYCPQQNGVAERANRTILDMARCMLIESKLPKSLWAEAVNTAAYIRNRCPTKALNDATPFEVWYKKKPNIGYFKSFGARAVALEKRPGRSKLDPRGNEYVFVGYSSESKSYRLWQRNTKLIIKRRDIKFFEEVEVKNYLDESVNIPGSNNYNELKLESDVSENDVFEICELEDNNNAQTDEEKSQQVEQSQLSSDEEVFRKGEMQPKSKGGRPKIVRTGRPGRPRIIRNSEDQVNLVFDPLSTDPVSFEEAMSRHDKGKWEEAVRSELNSLLRNNTWTITKCPEDTKVLQNRWVFCIKRKDGEGDQKYKARLVVKGCQQTFGVDYHETFSPVARYESIRLLLALCVEHRMLLHHMDVTTAYVQGQLNDLIYMEIPKGLKHSNECDAVCKLLKPLYGLKQAGRQWNIKLDTYLKSIGFRNTASEPCFYFKEMKGMLAFVVIYVDDILLASDSLELLTDTKAKLTNKFEIKDLGRVKDILGIKVKRDGERGKIEICQEHYIEKVLKRFGMEGANEVSTPLDGSLKLTDDLSSIEEENVDEMKDKPYRELIGTLMYLSNTSRPDIAYASNLLSRFSNQPRRLHWTSAKRVLRYLKATSKYKVTYYKTNEDMHGFVDSDWAGDCRDRKSCTGYLIFLGGSPVCWKTKKQKSVALSTMEAEYIAMSECSKEIIYLRKLLREIGMENHVNKPTLLYCDNQSAIKLANDNLFHEKSKHIDIRYHFTREVINRGEICLEYVPSSQMIADILTKPLDRIKHNNCIDLLKMDL